MRLTGSFREGFLANIAAGNAALDTFITAMDTRLTAASGSDAAGISGTITMNAKCENAGGTEYTHKFSLTFATGTVANALANVTTIVTAIDTLMDAVEAQSDYTTVTEVDVTANITVENTA